MPIMHIEGMQRYVSVWLFNHLTRLQGRGNFEIFFSQKIWINQVKSDKKADLFQKNVIRQLFIKKLRRPNGIWASVCVCAHGAYIHKRI